MDDKVIGVLGGGQLGRMLLQAASPLSIPIVVLDPEITAPAKQVSSPHLFPISTSSPPALSHLDGPFTSESKIRQLAQQVDILTIEIEHVDVEALQRVADDFKTTGGRSGNGVEVYPSPGVIRTIQDKYAQKVHLQARGIPVAPFLPITASPSSSTETTEEGTTTNPRDALRSSVIAAGESFGYPLMLKSRHLAYDGKGNFVLRSSSINDIDLALQSLIPDSSLLSETARPLTDRLYAEKWAPFVKEVAVMVVRGVDGQTRTYPAVETIHRDSVCHIVYAPLRPPKNDESGIGKGQKGFGGSVGAKKVDERAQEDARKAIDALGDGAVGVFGVEMFLLGDGSLLLNEIAPRPHNSGHYTIEACQPSQFTSHLYSILSLPLPPIHFIPASAGMLNLLGWSSSTSEDFLSPTDGVVRKAIQLGAAVHLYGKAGSRKGRKMGHITVLGESDDEVRRKIDAMVDCLPGAYKERVVAPETHDSPNPLVSIIMGSDSDLPIMLPATTILTSFGVPYELSIVSAHRTPARMVEFARTAEGRGVKVVIAGAGGAAHLPGMVASETTLPVVGVPVKASCLDGVDSLYSIVQMPRGIPVATMAINNSLNAALLAVRILSTQSPRLRKALEDYTEGLEEEVLQKVEILAKLGAGEYVKEKLGKK